MLTNDDELPTMLRSQLTTKFIFLAYLPSLSSSHHQTLPTPYIASLAHTPGHLKREEKLSNRVEDKTPTQRPGRLSTRRVRRPGCKEGTLINPERAGGRESTQEKKPRHEEETERETRKSKNYHCLKKKQENEPKRIRPKKKKNIDSRSLDKRRQREKTEKAKITTNFKKKTKRRTTTEQRLTVP